MRVNSVVIITSGMSDITTQQELGPLVRDLLVANKKIVLVLGPDGDDFLLNSQGLEECELAFDPNFNGGLFSSLKAGLHATHGATIVISINDARPDTVRRLLKFESNIAGDGSSLDCDLALPDFPDYRPDFFLITAKAVTGLRKLPAASPWPNPDLSVMRAHRPDPEP